MTLTASDLIYAALRKSNVVQKSETISTADLANALQALNIMIDEWSSSGILLRGTKTLSCTLANNQSSYTIFPAVLTTPGGDIDAVPPLNITSAYVEDTNSITTGIDIVTKEQYQAHQDKDIALSRPEELAYDPGDTQQAAPRAGTLWVYPMPDDTTTYTLYLESEGYLSEFAATDDEVTFEPAYYKALVYNLAVDLWPEFHAPDVGIPNNIAVQARLAKSSLYAMNNRPVTMAVEVPGKGSIYNIYTDDSY